MEITDKVSLQRARLSRAYLDQAKSFGIEQDLEFCPCLEPAAINSYHQSLVSNYGMNNISVRQPQQQSSFQQQSIDSESICKILAAAAANINSAKNINNSNNSLAYESPRSGSTAKTNNMNFLKNNFLKNQNMTNKTKYFS